MSQRRPAALLTVTCVAALALFSAACGSNSSDSGSSDTGTAEAQKGSGSSGVAEAEANLKAISGPKGSYSSPPTEGPTAKPGKSIFVVSYGQALPYFTELTKALQDAASSIGWSIKVWDGKFLPNEWLAGVRQGVTAKADAIIGLGLDCPTIKPGLQAAEAADIPYVAVEGYDCDVLKPGSKSYFDWTVTYQAGDLTEWSEAVGELQADWAIAHTDGKAKIIQFEETDAYTFRALIDGFEKGMKKCSECKVLERIKLTGLDYGPKLQQKAQQAILANPDANIVFPSGAESILDGGVAAAMRRSAGKLVSTGAEGGPSSRSNIESGVLGMTQNETPGWEAFSAVDALVRIFAGQKPTTKTGHGLRLIEKDQNFDDYKPYVAPVDYKSIYKKTWGAG